MAKTLKQLFTEQEQNIVQGRFHPEEPKKPIKGNVIVKPNVTENAEQITELSSETLDRYKDKAKKSSDALTSQGKYRQANDRTMNVMKATGKQINNTVANIRKALNKEETVTEGENKGMKDSDPCWTGYQMVGMKSKSGKKVPNCVPVKEAKEKTEYDYEGDMARGQLQSIINNSQRVHDMLKDNDNLPEWVQSKITLAEDYISTVANYMMSEIDEEVMQEATYVVKHDGVSSDHADADAKKLFAGKTNVNSHVSKYASSAEKHADMLKSKGFKNVRIQTMNKEEVEQLEEGRPSQRHPLEGHEYHKKTDAELIYIAKDAHKAAEAMKSHNTDAENKYRDQANDSATVRHFRKTSGMPEWYKKKYGHINEQMANAPFDPPYSKKTGTHIDKSGAKHGPMSIARDLARTAIAKQAKSINKSDPTRKANIVREAMKDAAIKDEKKKDAKKVTSGGKDKFQPDPEISTQIIRQE